MFADSPCWGETESIVKPTQGNTNCKLDADQTSWFYSDPAADQESWFNSDPVKQACKVGKICETDSHTNLFVKAVSITHSGAIGFTIGQPNKGRMVIARLPECLSSHVKANELKQALNTYWTTLKIEPSSDNYVKVAL